MQSKSEEEDAWMFLTCSEVVQDTVDGSSLGNYHTSPFSQKLHHTCNNYRLQQPKINKSLRGKSGWEAMIIKRLLCPHANVLLAQVALRDCPNELYPPAQTWFFYRLVNTWPSTRIAWQANRTLASVTKVLLAPNETILQKDCMRSKTNVSHYAEFYGSRCSPR